VVTRPALGDPRLRGRVDTKMGHFRSHHRTCVPRPCSVPCLRMFKPLATLNFTPTTQPGGYIRQLTLLTKRLVSRDLQPQTPPHCLIDCYDKAPAAWEFNVPTILIVDDDPASRDLASLQLQSIDEIRVLHADHAQAALKVLSQDPPDLVVTDLMLPDASGIDLIREVREQFPTLPIILMTAYGNENVVVDALRAGASSYVSKRTLRENLVNTVRQVLEVAHAERQKLRLMGHLIHQELHFELENDPELIPPLIALLLDGRQDIPQIHLNRTQLAVALQEALHNALYHGNLEISSKICEQGIEKFYEAAADRRDIEPYVNRRIHVHVKQTPDQWQFTIRDEGPGFDPSSVPDPTLPENMECVSGRGMLLMHSFMDQILYNETGNQVTLVKELTNN
jgi:DNA-binding response OmpR family regulator